MPVDAPGETIDDATASVRPSKWRPSRLAIVLVVIALVAMWGYVLFLAFGPGRQPPIDRLDDPAFALAAEERCAQAVSDVEALPVASASHTAEQRADVLEQANVVYADMLDDLGGKTHLVAAGEQRERTEEWLADWKIYLGDRQDFADALRSNPEARLLVSEKAGQGRHITGWIDEFANANRMESCITPPDA